ncbi:substance-P receptor-like protein, partial [Leptotrombidium deliense]
MRNPTNILLTNLAFADLGVSVFCIFQNLSLYLSSEWPLNDFMCKMYHFVQSLSYTCSVLTLVTISIERFLVIVYPLHARKALEKRKLYITLLLIWFFSVLICLPRLWMFGTAVIPTGTSTVLNACILKVNLYDPKAYHFVNFTALFLIPITIMTVIYTYICFRLYKREE